MKRWPPGTLIGLIAVVAVVALFGYSRFTQPSSEPATPPEGEAAQPPMKSADRLQQRLEQLREAHRSKLKGQADPIEARAGSVAPDQRMPRPKGAQPQGGGENAGEPPQVGDAPPFDEDPDDIPALTNVALHDSDPERRLAAVTMLGSADDPQVIPTLAQALADQDDEVRMAALEALSDFTDEPPVDLIARAADDPSPDIRFEAIDVLSDIGGDHARGVIEKALNDPDEDVRSLAEGIIDFEQLYDPTPSDAGSTDTPALPAATKP